MNTEERIEKYLTDAKKPYGEDIVKLFNTAIGFSKDARSMYGFGNIDGSIKGIEVLQKKVLKDLITSLKRISKEK